MQCGWRISRLDQSDDKGDFAAFPVRRYSSFSSTDPANERVVVVVFLRLARSRAAKIPGGVNLVENDELTIDPRRMRSSHERAAIHCPERSLSGSVNGSASEKSSIEVAHGPCQSAATNQMQEILLPA